MNHRFPLTAFALCWLLLCCTDNRPASGADAPLPDHPLADTLAAVVADYEALRLPAALARARRLRALLDTASVTDALRVQTYQYLALLHFEKGRLPDSISFYRDAAANLLDDYGPVSTRCRQLLVNSTAAYYTRSWLEMDMTCAYARKLLEESGDSVSLLYGQLLIKQAVARKQHADYLNEQGRPREDVRAVWAEANGLMDHAWDLLARKASPWQIVAGEEKVILATRLDATRQEVPAMIQRLATGRFNVAPAKIDRLWGYYYYRQDMKDCMEHHYRAVLSASPSFGVQDRKEATFIMIGAALNKKNYADALAIVTEAMVAADCCPEGTERSTAVDVQECLERESCIFYHATLSDILLRRFVHRGSRADAEKAAHLTEFTLTHYEAAFRHLREEGALNQLLSSGQRLLDGALRTAVNLAAIDSSFERADAVFRAMEIGRSFLLLKELTQVPADTVLNKLEVDLRLITSAYSQHRRLSVPELKQFVTLTEAHRRERQALKRGQQTAPTVSLPATVPTLSTVRRQLEPGQALIEFAETSSERFALYVDRASFRVYALPDTAGAHVARFTRQLQQSDDPAAYDRSANGLYQALLGPVAPSLAECSELLIVPSASLQDVSFSALTVTARPQSESFAALDYLLDHTAVRYLESWRVKEELDQRHRPDDGAGYHAGIWTHGELEGYLGRLGDTLLAHSSPRSKHYRATTSSSQSLLANAPRYDLLHLSIHARGNPARIHDNYLYLGSQDSLNGIHLSTLPLTADLVVLAACSTSRGYTGRGEGTFSLRRSFHVAGVPDVLASFYDIPAYATAVILQQFYDYHLAGNFPPALALTKALRDCRNGRLNRRWVRPVFWGGLLVG